MVSAMYIYARSKHNMISNIYVTMGTLDNTSRSEINMVSYRYI